MSKTFRLAATQVKFGWSDAATPVNPYGGAFDPGSVPAHIEGNVRKQLRLFEQAGRRGADLVVGAEDMQRLGHFGANLDNPQPFLDLVETIPGPTSKRVGAIARKYKMLIVACYPERAGKKFYNTGVLFGRNGRILGKYRKVQLPANEARIFSAGDDFPVFRTDLGNVGIAICYDMMFPEPARCLALNGADVIAHPTMGYGWNEEIGGATLMTRCVDNGVTIVMSCTTRSQVRDSWGNILCDAGRRPNVVVWADGDTRGRMMQDPNAYASVDSGFDDVRERWTKERRAKCFKVIASPNPPLMKRYSKKRIPATFAEKHALYKISRNEARRLARGGKPRLVW